MQDRKGSFCSYYEVSPPDETALVTAVGNSQQRAIGNLTTGAKNDWTDQNRGSSGDETSSSSAAEHSYSWHKEFLRSPEGART